jgi:arylsulfatase A-like enzyme
LPHHHYRAPATEARPHSVASLRHDASPPGLVATADSKSDFAGVISSTRFWRLAIVFGCALVLPSAGRFCARAVAQAERPNIVYILADDMGFGDIRSYNPSSPVNTPNIDRIAAAGMRFRNAHSSSSVCSPTRYSILTGRYAWRTSLQAGVLGAHAPGLIEPSRLTVGEMLQQAGYSTAAIGKWHLGENWVTTNGGVPFSNGTNVNYTQPFTNGPTAHGFDTYFGTDVINLPPYSYIRDNRTVGADLHTPAVPVGQPPNNTPFVPPGGSQLGLVTPGFDLRKVMPDITNEAVGYISTHATQSNPFFLYFPLTAPHNPIFPPEFLQGTSGVTGPMQAYGDFIATVDWAVGRVLDTLEDPNGDADTSDSILDDTLIVFTADNGAEGHLAFPTSPGTIGGTPLRGDKHLIYEGGHRVPLIAQWGNRIQAGSASDQLVELNDFMATVADVIDYQLPASAAPDSVSIAPLLLGQTSDPARSRGVQHSVGGAFAFRQFDERGQEWKLIFTSTDGLSEAGRHNPMTPISDFSRLQLYNLTTNPGEHTNLLSGGGTPAMQQRATAMQSVLQQFISSGQSSPLGLLDAEDRVMRIDVGLNTQQTLTTGWNNFTGVIGSRPEVVLQLVDTTGSETGYTFSTDWTFTNGSDSALSSDAANYNGPYPAEVAGIPDSALRNSAFVRDGAVLTMTLDNLDMHAEYDFLFYGAAGTTGDYSLFTATGSNNGQANISPLVDNSTKVAKIDGIVPNAEGIITLLFEGRRPDGSPHLPGVGLDALGRLNFIQIVERLVPVLGDFNNDRLVNAADYGVWRANFGSTTNLAADANENGVVDTADFVIWRRAMSSSAGGGAATQTNGSAKSLPEPQSAILLTMVFIAIACRRRVYVASSS